MLSRIGKGILFIYLFFILSLVLAISIAIIRSQLHKKADEKREKIVETYQGEVEKYLEVKYGRPFQVEAVYYSENGGSPIPGARHYSPYEYEVYEKQGDGCPFRVLLYPKSLDDKSIEKIEDNYCWKYLRNQVKAYFQQELADLLPKEYKMVFLTDDYIMIDDYIKPRMPMEIYFRRAKSKVSIMIYVIAPPEDWIEEKLTDDKVLPIVNDFYEKNNRNMELHFSYSQTLNYDDYDNINVEDFECTKFKLYRNIFVIWDEVDLETKLLINIE